MTFRLPIKRSGSLSEAYLPLPLCLAPGSLAECTAKSIADLNTGVVSVEGVYLGLLRGDVLNALLDHGD